MAGILSRVTNLVRANINDLLKKAEDPEKMIELYIQDYKDAIQEAEDATAGSIGDARQVERDAETAQKAVAEWEGKAKAAAGRAKQAQDAGNGTEAGRFMALARKALDEKRGAEANAEALAKAASDQGAMAEQLKQGITQMRAKLKDMQEKKNEYITRARSVEARKIAQEAMSKIDISDPLSSMGTYMEDLKAEERKLEGHAELAADRGKDEYAELNELAQDADIEDELARLMADAGGSTSRGAASASDVKPPSSPAGMPGAGSNSMGSGNR